MTRFRIMTLILVLSGLFVADMSAQNYSSAIGLRLGRPNSISYKTFISSNTAVEGYASFRSFSNYSSIGLNAAYLIHKDTGWTEGMDWYYGVGPSLFFWSFNSAFVGDTDANLGIGVAGYLGLEYTFADAPVTLSADWVPVFLITGFSSGFAGGNGALAARYILN